MRNVLSAQIYTTWPSIDPADVDAYLYNTQAPGYFGSDSFLQGGTSPGTEYDNIDIRLANLTPYNPVSISNLVIAFD